MQEENINKLFCVQNQNYPKRVVLGISSNYTYHSFKNKISAIETETLNKSLKLNGNIIR